MKYEFNCLICGKHTVVYRASFQKVPQYCSNECKFKSQIGKKRKTHITLSFNCDYCGKLNERYETPDLIVINRLRFCNKTCRNKYQVADKNPNYKNGVRKVKGGYIAVYTPNHPHADCYGCVFKHRLMMEDKIGRILNIGEVVHHLNGHRDDNRIENLKLCKSQSDHMKQHRIISKRGRYERIKSNIN